MGDTAVSPPGSPIVGPGGRKQEFFVRSATSWKRERGQSVSDYVGGGGRRSKEVQMRETADILAGCAEDMQAVWEDPLVRQLLVHKGVRMEATPGL